jgi:hypothetical protein
MEASDERREMLAAQRRRGTTRMHIVETETEPPFHIVVVSAPDTVARVSDALVRVPDERECPRCHEDHVTAQVDAEEDRVVSGELLATGAVGCALARHVRPSESDTPTARPNRMRLAVQASTRRMSRTCCIRSSPTSTQRTKTPSSSSTQAPPSPASLAAQIRRTSFPNRPSPRMRRRCQHRLLHHARARQRPQRDCLRAAGTSVPDLHASVSDTLTEPRIAATR